jgi:capsular exopolysaccharide synthesis family protein
MANQEKKNEIDLMEYWRVILKRKWVIATFLGAIVFFTLVFSFLATPIYRAKTTLLIEEDTSRLFNLSEALNYQPQVMRDLRSFNTQVNLLKSKTLSERVAQNLNLVTRPEFGGGKKKGRSLIDTSRHILTFRWLSSSKDSDSSKAIPAAAADPYSSIADSVRNNLDIRPVRETKLVELSYPSTSPVLAAEIVNALAEEFINFSVEKRTTSTQQAADFLGEQIAIHKEELVSLERELQKYGQEKELDMLTETESSVVGELERLQEAHTQATINRVRAESRYRQLSNLDVEVDPIPQFLSNPAIQQARSEYMRKKNEFEEAKEFYKESYPQMIQLKASLDNLRNDFQAELQKAVDSAQAEYESAQREERTIARTLDRIKGNAEKMNSNAIHYRSLRIDVDNKRKLIDSLTQKQNETLVSARLESLKMSNVHIIDPAEVPKRPVSPKKKLNLMLALMIGLFGGTALCFLIEYLDNTVKGPEDVEKISGLPSLGVIPYLDINGARTKKKSRLNIRNSYGRKEEEKNTIPPEIKEIELINHRYPVIPISEDYKTIRTSILLSSADNPPKSFVVTSSLPMEGKSATAANMGVAFAQLGERVLMIDSDLRKPRLHNIFGIKKSGGLSKYLTGKISLKDAIQKTSIENIYVLPTGPIPPNPSELLNSIKMKDMMEEVKSGFDFILIDTPPVLAVMDSLIVSSLADATVFVIRAGKTTRRPFMNAIEELNRARAKIIGVLFNGLKVKKGDYYFMDYYRYYQYDYYRYGNGNDGVRKRA